jgi:hypothetical protein
MRLFWWLCAVSQKLLTLRLANGPPAGLFKEMERELAASAQKPTASQAGGGPGMSPSPQGITAIYFNGFGAGISMGDIAIPISLNGVHFATLNVSYSVAKTLGESLVSLISTLETATGNHIMTAQEIEKATAKLRE